MVGDDITDEDTDCEQVVYAAHRIREDQGKGFTEGKVGADPVKNEKIN